MAKTIPTQIRIDANVKKDASILFDNLGLDMSSAVNIFLRQCLLRGGLPFQVELPQYNEETLAAMTEAKLISKDPTIPSYSSAKAMFNALNDDV